LLGGCFCCEHHDTIVDSFLLHGMAWHGGAERGFIRGFLLGNDE
jgi:hypothetical protein